MVRACATRKGQFANTLTVSEAKAHFSAVLERVLAGEQIAIGRRGRPEVVLSRFSEIDGPRPLGTYDGPLVLAEDFDDSLSPEILVTTDP